ncbi:hypothetical protein [Sphingomonas sp. YL-JM2C]
MKKREIDNIVFAAIEAGAKCRASIRAKVGSRVEPAEIVRSIERLRYSGRVQFGKIAVNRIEPAPVTIAEQVKAEAIAAGDRRHAAGKISATVRDPLMMTPVERVVAGMVETPGDLYLLVKRQWPELLAQVIRQARRNQVSPVRQLVATIERGLS